MNPALQKILNDTAQRRGVDIGWMGAQQAPLQEAPVWVIEDDIVVDETSPAIEAPVEDTMPVISVDAIYDTIAIDVSALWPNEVIDLAYRILANQIPDNVN